MAPFWSHRLTEKVVEKLTAAILDLVELYCSTFNANFHTTPQNQSFTAPVQEAGLVTNVLSFSVYAAHRIPITWAARYDQTATDSNRETEFLPFVSDLTVNIWGNHASFL